MRSCEVGCEVGQTPSSARGPLTPQFSCRKPDQGVRCGTGVPPHFGAPRLDA